MGEITNGAVILDTPSEIDWFRFMLGWRALSLEVKTGIKTTRGFKATQFFGAYGFKSKRLKPLLAEVQAYIEANAADVPQTVYEAVRIDNSNIGGF